MINFSEPVAIFDCRFIVAYLTIIIMNKMHCSHSVTAPSID